MLKVSSVKNVKFGMEAEVPLLEASCFLSCITLAHGQGLKVAEWDVCEAGLEDCFCGFIIIWR